MNKGTITGGVIHGAENAYTAPTKEVPSMRRVLFKIAARDHLKADSVWNCEAEDNDELLDFLVREAQPGTGIKLDYELAARPFYKHGIHTGESRFLRVFAAEIKGVRVPAELEFAGAAPLPAAAGPVHVPPSSAEKEGM